jgi:hypothetical protein
LRRSGTGAGNPPVVAEAKDVSIRSDSGGGKMG